MKEFEQYSGLDIIEKHIGGLAFASLQEQGPRPEQEDVFEAKELPNGDALFVLADGHGAQGARAAKLCVATVIKHMDDMNTSFTARHAGKQTGSAAWWNSLFMHMNDQVLEKTPDSGSTLTVVAICEDAILSVHAGDSQARVFRVSGEGKTLAIPHRPRERNEKKRLHDMSALVAQGRIISGSGVSVAVSRALGYPVGGEVSCVPDIQQYTRTPEDRFLVLCSDGLSDVLFEKQRRRHRAEQVLSECHSTADATQQLKVLLDEYGLIDNTTFAVIDIQQAV